MNVKHGCLLAQTWWLRKWDSDWDGILYPVHALSFVILTFFLLNKADGLELVPEEMGFGLGWNPPSHTTYLKTQLVS